MPATAEPTATRAKLLTAEVAELLRVDPATVLSWSKAGIIPAPSRLSRKHMIWDRAEIEAFLEARKAEPRGPRGAA